MIKKVDTLTNIELNWAVAKCLRYAYSKESFIEHDPYEPSEDWSLGGPIIETQFISIECTSHNSWKAYIKYFNESTYESFGSTPLIAAMRCFIISILGNKIETPNKFISL